MKILSKTLLSALAFAGALTTSTFAAETPSDAKPGDKPAAREPGQRRRSRLDQLAEDVKLTEDQKTKLAPVLQDENKKLKEVRENTELTKEQKAAKAKEIRAESAAKVKEVLTAEQSETLKKVREERAKNAPEGGGRGPRRQGGGDKPAKPSKAQ